MGHALPNCPGSGIQENHGHCPYFANSATKLSVFQLYRTVQVMIIFSQLHAESVEQNNSVNLRQLVETPETWHSLVTGMDGNLALELQANIAVVIIDYLFHTYADGFFPKVPYLITQHFQLKWMGDVQNFLLGNQHFYHISLLFPLNPFKSNLILLSNAAKNSTSQNEVQKGLIILQTVVTHGLFFCKSTLLYIET